MDAAYSFSEIGIPIWNEMYPKSEHRKGDTSIHTKIAESILAHICYATLATATKGGMPWSSPVYTAFDSDGNFYWLSSHQARHSRNIRENSQIACVVFDSTAPEGTGKGVYIQAVACELSETKEIARGLLCLFKRVGETPPPADYVGEASPLRVYKAIPHGMWINAGNDVNGIHVDKRIAIDINRLISSIESKRAEK